MLVNYLRQILTVVLFSMFSAAVAAAPFSKLVAFSGSLSDTGNYASVNGDFPAPNYNNRTTNGPAAIDILAEKFGLSAEPSLHLIGRQGGTNFATLHASAAGDLPIDLPAQLQAYLGPRNNIADPAALYFIFIGANDIVAAVLEQDEQKSEVILQNGINAVDNAFRQLHAAGARTFYAPNNVNLGITPITKEFGVSARATQKTLVFNRLWEKQLRQLERELNVTIYRFDFFRLVEDLLGVGEKLGFTDVTHSCLALVPQGLCDLEHFAFLTELLPTKKIHDFLGNALALSLVQQLNSPHCSVKHRCGRKHGTRSYAVIDVGGSAADFEDDKWWK